MIMTIQDPMNLAANPARPATVDTLDTARLSLTALRVNDLEDLMRVFGDAATARMTHTLPHPFTVRDARTTLQAYMNDPHAHRAIRNDGRLIGVISLTASGGGDGDLHNFGPNLRVVVAPDQRGQGYGVEAINGLLGFVRRRRLHRVVHAAHFADNGASARMLICADFLYTGRRTQEASLAREGLHPALHMVRIL